MRDELEAPFLDEWFYETEVPPPDPKEGARRVASRLPHTKQVGRWLPFPVFRRKAQTPTATDTTDYQPTSIPATNGHTPTVLGSSPSEACCSSPSPSTSRAAFPGRRQMRSRPQVA